MLVRARSILFCRKGRSPQRRCLNGSKNRVIEPTGWLSRQSTEIGPSQLDRPAPPRGSAAGASSRSWAAEVPAAAGTHPRRHRARPRSGPTGSLYEPFCRQLDLQEFGAACPVSLPNRVPTAEHFDRRSLFQTMILTPTLHNAMSCD
jgi:hypothetical protein